MSDLISDVQARQVFARGDRVIASLRGLMAGAFPDAKYKCTGYVVGFSRLHHHCVLVRIDGKKSKQTFAWWFWERFDKRTHSKARQ